MAMRRPRIKATALLTTKRKSRDVKSEQNGKPPSSEGVETTSQGDEPTKEVTVEATANESEIVASVGSNDATIIDANVSNVEVMTDYDEAKVQKNLDPSLITSTKAITGEEAKDAVTDGVVAAVTASAAGGIDAIIEAVQPENPAEVVAPQNNVADEIVVAALEPEQATNVSFKRPPRVEYNRNNSQVTSVTGSDDVFYSDMEEAALQADLQRTVNGYPMSPSKTQARQRIRPVPVFQRRNSFVGVANSPQTPTEEAATTLTEIVAPITSTPSTVSATANSAQPPAPPPPPMHPIRRERHYSASMSQNAPTLTSAASSHHHYTAHKFTPSMGRIRTESNCSAFSDSYPLPSKQRKTEEHNHRAYSRRDFEARLANGALDKSSLKMFDLIYYNPVTNPMEQRSMLTVKKEATPESVDAKSTEAATDTASTTKMELSGAPSAMPVPQLKLNANGDLILDEKTLEIETTAEQEARKVLANSSLIVLDDNTGMNGFYRRQKRTKEWPPEETIKFYRCLQTVGTDFSLMCQLFPKRTRRDLKLKFKKEERSNLALINKALLYPKIFNIDDLKVQLETEERQREEDQRRWKEIKEREAKSIKKVKINTSVAARALKNGDDVYQNENVIKRKLSKRAVGDKNKAEATKQAKTQQPTTADERVTTRTLKTKPVPAQSTQPPAATPSIKEELMLHTNNEVVMPVKIEGVKLEHNVQRINTVPEPPPESQQLEEEMTELLQPADEDITASHVDNTIQNVQHCADTVKEAETEMKLLVGLDNDVISALAEDDNVEEFVAITPIKDNANAMRRELDESDIQKILTELAEGSLVLVSTLDPDNADKVVNEIYMLDNATGELCDTPLDIPDEIVQSILSVMC